jgi:hypothetical protein
MAAKESQLSAVELGSLDLKRLIFHVYNPSSGGEPLICLDADVPLTQGTYAAFFKERLRDSSRGTQFTFHGNHLPTRDLCAKLIAQPNQIVPISKEIAEAFASHHRGRQMAAGVIIIALASVITGGSELGLVFILKVDHKPVLTYQLDTDDHDLVTARVKAVADALVEDKAAVQRSALIDISTTYAWDVLASERNEGVAPELRQFFKAFLSVEMREDASVLTRRAVETVSAWSRALSTEDRPTDEIWHHYRERATQYMRDHAEFDTDDFIDTVVRDEDRERRERTKQSLKDVLAEKGLSGQSFDTRPNSLSAAQRKTQLITDEGVKISYEGDRGSRRITVKDDPERGLGAKIVTILTTGITESGGV